MSQFDLAIGMDKTTLNQGIAQLYSDSQAREKLFKGSMEGDQHGLHYVATWDIQGAPTFVLENPPEDKWKDSLNKQGQHPDPADRPTHNSFQFVFPKLYAKYVMGTASVDGAGEVTVFATVYIQNDALSIEPISVWLDESTMKGWDKFILNQVILPQVLNRAQELLSSIDIPTLSYNQDGVNISFTSPVVEIVNGWLILASSLASKGTVDILNVQWPTESLFVLMSSDALIQVVEGAANSKLKGTSITGSDTYKSVLDYDYEAKVGTVEAVVPSPQDMTRMSANVQIGFSATMKPLGIGGPCAISAATGSL